MADEPEFPNGDARRLAALARTLLTRGGTLESTEGSGPMTSAALRQAVQSQLGKAEAALDSNTALESTAASLAVNVAASDVVAAAENAIRKVDAAMTASPLTDFEMASLEAIVLIVGRPAMRFSNGSVEMPSPVGDNIRWSTFVATARSRINDVSASIGRVGFAHENAADEPVATAWRLGKDLVVTNRHVAADLVEDATRPRSEWKLHPTRPCVVDFTATNNAATLSRFSIAELVHCAEEDDLDLAILRLTPGDQKLPDPLDPDWEADSLGRDIDGRFHGEEIYVVGHPYRLEGSNAISTVFGKADGYKRCSPGLVTTMLAQRPIFEHDCSTLGGNSGSCVLSVSGHAVVGLHFAGVGVNKLTAMGRANVALAISKLSNQRAVEILKKGHA